MHNRSRRVQKASEGSILGAIWGTDPQRVIHEHLIIAPTRAGDYLREHYGLCMKPLFPPAHSPEILGSKDGCYQLFQGCDRGFHLRQHLAIVGNHPGYLPMEGPSGAPSGPRGLPPAGRHTLSACCYPASEEEQQLFFHP